jgi:hypothetical protein
MSYCDVPQPTTSSAGDRQRLRGDRVFVNPLQPPRRDDIFILRLDGGSHGGALER